jgi:hypothetical protein
MSTLHRANHMAYLAVYAEVCGADSLDATVRIIHALRRRDARILSAARRSTRVKYAMLTTAQLHSARKITAHLLSKACAPLRGENIHRADRARLRMIDNELRRRDMGFPSLADAWSSRFTR